VEECHGEEPQVGGRLAGIGRADVRVLVTGATGFVGSHTAAALAASGHEVCVLARTPAKVPLVLGPLGVDPEVVAGDMTDPVAVAAAVSGCDAVIHAAAQIGVGGGGSATEANLAGSRRSSVPRSAARTGTPARSTMFRRFV